LDQSPFEVLYGHKTRHFGIQIDKVCQEPELDNWLQERLLMVQAIKQHLLRAQQRMKIQADKNRPEVSFELGDEVFFKLQSYVHSSLARRAHQKLAFKYFGPYTVEEKIGLVAYHLKLSTNSSIYPIFHVSQLKKLVSPTTSVLPNYAALHQVPESVLDTRMVRRGDAEVPQVLIKWSNMAPELATWEDKEAVKQ
jgi:hypothetical protein